MTTRKLFWEDPYRTSLATTIVSVEGSDVTLAATIFYALAGGQESDAGSIAGRTVLRAHWEGRDIVYTLADATGLAAGIPVVVDIDWARRYRLMRLHFAAELVLELVCKRMGTIEKIGAHISEDKARIDFTWPENISAQFPQLLAAAQDIIAADSAIVSAFEDEAGERRYWEVEGFARVPCGGTHLKRTGEVGTINLKRKNVGRGKERIEIYVD